MKDEIFLLLGNRFHLLDEDKDDLEQIFNDYEQLKDKQRSSSYTPPRHTQLLRVDTSELSEHRLSRNLLSSPFDDVLPLHDFDDAMDSSIDRLLSHNASHKSKSPQSSHSFSRQNNGTTATNSPRSHNNIPYNSPTKISKKSPIESPRIAVQRRWVQSLQEQEESYSNIKTGNYFELFRLTI